ncbi:UPF0103-domain-containing protein [Ramicandelaber brevisporus]|nr:UPF0103-domain-containing protein [Ramicandelaber brevisporus]
MSSSSTRAASHAGSWYSKYRSELQDQLDSWLSAARRRPLISVLSSSSSASTNNNNSNNNISNSATTAAATVVTGGHQVVSRPVPGARAIISPHAGYSYSGPAAAHAFASLDLTGIKRVFILGPSHHVYIPCCAVPDTRRCTHYATPLGNLMLDRQTIDQLRSQHPNSFKNMSMRVDEDEHSIEMQLPYLYAVLAEADLADSVQIVPIMVGAIDFEQEAEFGQLLAPHLANPENAFVISSDFCHWGKRFDYCKYYPSLQADTKICDLNSSSSGSSGGASKLNPAVAIYKSIEHLDHRGMAEVETGQHARFGEYLSETRNTICGRHPIGVLLAAIESVYGHIPHGVLQPSRRNLNSSEYPTIRFVHYSQSSKVQTVRDSSVSYASAYVVLPAIDSQ